LNLPGGTGVPPVQTGGTPVPPDNINRIVFESLFHEGAGG
jgi:hypothetical protein